MAGGRPTKYNLTLAAKICRELEKGRSLTSICKDEDMPDVATVYRWVHDYAEFCDMYTQSRQLQAETMLDHACDIADGSSQDWKERVDKDGNVCDLQPDHEAINRSRLRVETRLKLAEKLAPKKYGQRLNVDADVRQSVTETSTEELERIIKGVK